MLRRCSLSRAVSKLPRRSFLFALGLAGLVAVSTSGEVRAQVSFNRIVAFGDSLSDNGNFFARASSLGLPLPQAPYVGGRMSNGPVWVEQFASTLGVTLDDFAFIGARTDSTNLANDFPLVPANTFPGMQTQVTTFLTGTGGVADPNALYVLWGGANDYLNGNQTNPTIPVANIVAQMNALANAGATQFLIPNLPNLGSVPGTSSTPLSGLLNLATAGHNLALTTTLDAFRLARPNVSVALLDINTLFTQVMANGAAFGFDNVTDNYVSNPGEIPGLGAVVEGTGDPNRYLFWDEIHPTEAGHRQVALGALAAVAAPEPGTLALATVGGGITLLTRRRRRAGGKRTE
jgi:phospholipase/lecithinase/hemolysin